MNRAPGTRLIVIVVAALIAPTGLKATPDSDASTPGSSGTTVDVSGGVVTFEVGTNVAAIKVHGRSTNLRGRAQIRETVDSFAIDRLDATLAVKTISTGMGLRDEHMRKYIFETADGQTPDLTVTDGSADCAAPGAKESICKVLGQLTIRGTSRPFTMTLTARKTNHSYQVAGSGTVRLSTYGIAPPSQFGVTTSDEVQLRVEFTAKLVEESGSARHEGGR